MKITIIYDNTTFNDALESDWGFAALVESCGRKFLFDTGQNGRILMNNMAKLDIDPLEITDVIISHNHFDHTGGLSDFLNTNPDVKLWLPPSFRGVKSVKDVTELSEPSELYRCDDEIIHSTGEIDDKEQAIFIETQKGIVIIVGCTHPDLRKIKAIASEYGDLYAIVGGLHGTDPSYLDGFSLICPTHCTQHIPEIKLLYPECFLEGGAGKIITI